MLTIGLDMTGADLRQILSKNLKSLRSQRSLSQVELAERANISIPFLSNIERNNKWPHPDTLVKLAEALDVDVYLLFLENRESISEDTQIILDNFRKDMVSSLNKSIAAAISDSVNKISSHYAEEKSE